MIYPTTNLSASKVPGEKAGKKKIEEREDTLAR